MAKLSVLVESITVYLYCTFVILVWPQLVPASERHEPNLLQTMRAASIVTDSLCNFLKQINSIYGIHIRCSGGRKL
jgi:hypothetical protein